jgi:hypothetical protein
MFSSSGIVCVERKLSLNVGGVLINGEGFYLVIEKWIENLCVCVCVCVCVCDAWSIEC